LHAATCALVGQLRPAVYETAAVRKYPSLLSDIGEWLAKPKLACGTVKPAYALPATARQPSLATA